jgi:hypothetical protein
LFVNWVIAPFGKMYVSSYIPDDRCAQVDLFHQPALAVDDRHIADAYLIFRQQKEPSEEVAHEILRAESDRDARDAGAGQQRTDVKADLAQRHHDRHRPNGEPRRSRSDARKRVRALLGLQRPQALAVVVFVFR